MADDHQMEIEALQAIYMDEIEIFETETPGCQIKIIPTPGGDDTDNYLGAFLTVHLVATYPDTAPEWQVREAFGMSRVQVDELRDFVTAYFDDHLGSQMIFGLVEAIREWLVERNAPPAMSTSTSVAPKPAISAEEAEEAALLAALEEESKDPMLGGTIVTVDAFNTWWDGFTKEMEANGTPVIPKKGVVVTGRQLFDQYQSLCISDLAYF